MNRYIKMTSYTLAAVIIGLTVVSLSACKGKTGAGVLISLLCGRGEQKSKMTAGFDLSIIKSVLGLKADAPVSDEEVKGYLNNFLETKSISPSTFTFSSVESVKEGDNVRFLQLGGTVGDAFGAAIGYIKSIFSSSSLTASNPFTFMSESYGVNAAAAENIYRERKVRTFLQNWAPFMVEEQNMTPNDKQWVYKQADLSQITELYTKMLAASGRDISADPIIVAVLDTGADLEHPDLQDAFLRDENGDIVSYDATGDNYAQDENGHGTHCAGIIGGRVTSAESALGIATMANVKILPIKVLGAKGSGGFQEIEKGIRWAMHHGAQVISMSLGGGMEYSDIAPSGGGAPKNNVIADAVDSGILVLIAAGNESCPLGGKCKNSGGLFQKTFDAYTVLPCAYDKTICVGATDPDDTLAEYSNYSSNKTASYRTRPDINAPGTSIYSTWPTKLGSSYKIISGTSMATPFTAGVAALIKTVVPSITNGELRSILEQSKVDTDDLTEKSGTGRLDVYTALLIVAKNYLELSDLPELDKPIAKPVPDAPEPTGGSGTVGLISDLWGSVCQ